MAGTLVIAELHEGHVRKSTHSAITFAKQLGAPFTILVVGANAKAAAADVTGFGAAKVLAAAAASLKDYVCARFAPTVAAVATSGGFDTVVVTASSFGKDLAPRVAAKLDAGYAPDINQVTVDGPKRVYRRPMFAGNVYGTCEITTPVHVVSVRQTEFAPAEPTAPPLVVVAPALVDVLVMVWAVCGGSTERFALALELWSVCPPEPALAALSPALLPPDVPNAMPARAGTGAALGRGPGVAPMGTLGIAAAATAALEPPPNVPAAPVAFAALVPE